MSLIDDYIKRCITIGDGYQRDVIAGKINVGDNIKLAAIRQKELKKKYIYKKQELVKVYKFLFYCNITHNNQVQRFVPTSWQCWVINSIYSLYKNVELNEVDAPDPDVLKFQDAKNNIKHQDIERLFQHALILIGRKNGKSILAGLLGLYGLTKEQRGAEVFLYGIEKQQAMHLLDYQKEIINISPALRKRIDILQYSIRYTKNGKCVIKPMAFNGDKQDGYKPTLVIFDEYAAYPDRSVNEIMQSGQGATLNPLNLYITTANFFPEYPIGEDIEIGQKVLKNEINNDRYFYALYQLDDETEIDDPNNWIKANPSIGATTKLSTLKEMYNTASLTLSGKRNFLVKNLNFFLKSHNTWIEDSFIKDCSKQFNYNDLVGGRAWLGLDLSQSVDLSSLAITIEHPDTKELYQIFKTYFPSKQGNKKLRKTGIDLTDWINKGFIKEHPNQFIDEDLIYDDIMQIINDFDVNGIVYDPYSAKKIISRLENNLELMLNIKPFPQQTRYFNTPIRELEKLIYSNKITFEQNPLFRYNIQNIVPYYDYNGYVKFDKNKSKDVIDMAVSSAMSIGAYLDTEYDLINMMLNEIKQD